jgi:lipooligosaccharide transport system ATP-binding protein
MTHTAAAPLLVVDQLLKRYQGVAVVDGLSFSLAAGECLGVLGPNGAGKTTTLRMCLGHTMADAGSVNYHLHGAAQALTMPRDASAIKASLGVVSQFDALDPDFTCEENVAVFGRYFGLRGAALTVKARELLDFAVLSSRAGAKPSELSGGMKRRLSLARALVNDPQLLLLDEPTTGLDPQARHLMWERLQQLMHRGKSILLTTHFMDEAERLCHRLIIVDHGKKITEGTPRALIEQHIEPEVVELFGQGARAHAHGPCRALAQRVETSGETVFMYTRHAAPLLHALQQHAPGVRTLHRPANLEDLFLKLTGRQIREGA